MRRNLAVRPGQGVDSGTLVECRSQLTASGFFETVQVYTTRGSRPGAVVLVVEVKLARRWRIETGVGREDLSGWYLNLFGLRYASPFGRGGEARIGIHEGLQIGGYFSELLIPEVGHPDHDLLVDVAAYERVWVAHDGDQTFQQDNRFLRTRVGLRHRLSPRLSATLWGGFLGLKPDETLSGEDEGEEEPVGRLLPRLGNHEDYLESHLEVLWDGWDPERSWQAGRWGGLRVRAADRIDGPGFWGAEIDGRTALPVGRSRALAFRARAAWTGPGTPYHQRYPVGGARSLRGFTAAGLSDPQGAEALWQGTVEWRRFLAGKSRRRPTVLGTVFLDFGDHWNSAGDRHGVAASVGYGAQFWFPWIQILTLEMGYPLTGDPTGNPLVAHLTFGRSF